MDHLLSTTFFLRKTCCRSVVRLLGTYSRMKLSEGVLVKSRSSFQRLKNAQLSWAFLYPPIISFSLKTCRRWKKYNLCNLIRAPKLFPSDTKQFLPRCIAMLAIRQDMLCRYMARCLDPTGWNINSRPRQPLRRRPPDKTV